jgi:hypothetical protein
MKEGGTAMNYSKKTKSMLVLMACVVLCFCWSLNVYAFQDQTNIENLSIIDAGEAITPAGPIDVVQCILYALDELFIGFQICGLDTGFNPGCYADAITDFAFTVPQCLLFLLTDFDREDPPPPPDDNTPDELGGWCTVGLCEEDWRLHGTCVEFMERCLDAADTEVDIETCAGAGFLICIDIF